MSYPKWAAKHVRTLAELPAKLTIGRAYFIDDEHYIIIDHGQGPVIYGNKAGPQGEPGEPIPILQHQIDALAEGLINNALLSKMLSDKSRVRDEELRAELQSNLDTVEAGLLADIANERAELSLESEAREENDAALLQNINVVDNRRNEDLIMLYSQIEQNSKSLMDLAVIVSTLADNLRGTEATLLKLLLDNEAYNSVTPLKQYDTLSTSDGYTWNVAQADISGTEGTLIFSLNS